VISQFFYPQFLSDLHADDCLDPKIDERRAKSKWQGDSMDIQQVLQCMFELEKWGAESMALESKVRDNNN
jgi:hypothetical protein